MNPVIRAYSVLFGNFPPPGINFWEVVVAVMNNFSGQALDENLARDLLETVIVSSGIPDYDLRTKIVGRAEELLPEFSEDYDPLEEVHMALVERVMFQRAIAQGAF